MDQLKSVRVVLRLTILLQCLGNAWGWMVQKDGALVSFFHSPRDVGGLNLAEPLTLNLLYGLGIFVLVVGVFTLFRSSGWTLLALGILQVLIASAMWQIGEGIMPAMSLFSQSTRIVAPFALFLLDPWRKNWNVSPAYFELAVQMMRIGIGLTFIAHGIEALEHYGKFIDLNLIACRRLFDYEMTEENSERLLNMIGLIDLVVGVLVMGSKTRWIIGYMAFWGFITAISRVVAGSIAINWPDFATRAPHFGIPLALLLLWCYLDRLPETHNEGFLDEQKL